MIEFDDAGDGTQRNTACLSYPNGGKLKPWELF